MAWGNIYTRRVKVFTLAIIMYLDYKALQKREKWVSKSKRDSMWEKLHERNAKRVLKVIIELEGMWVKLGQYMSTRADVLPNAYIRVLTQLQDSLPPRPLKVVCETIEKEFGKSMRDMFCDFVQVPLATASIAQVHRATLTDGREVVVKVQHEGIKSIILEDLKNAKSIVDWIAWAEPQYDFNPVIDEWCKEAPKELDFNREAENTSLISRNLGCNNQSDEKVPANCVDVLIPEVIQSTERVLILEYMDGVRLNDLASLENLGVDKQKLVEEITRAYAHQIYVGGIFNGDPHPGNFLVSKVPPHRPILLDFGLTKVLTSSMKQGLAKMFLASVEGDHAALLSALAEMGFRFRMDLPDEAMEVTALIFRNSAPSREEDEHLKSYKEKAKLKKESLKLSQKESRRFNPVDAFPGDIVIFSRVLNLLRGLSSIMKVRINYVDIMRPFAESVLQCNIDNGPRSNAQWIYNTPVHSDVEAKLRHLLVELGNADKILGIQVCAYKGGQVIIDTAAGVLGRYDPRPVQPDTLFNVFSATKGITAGMVHWLVDNRKLKLDENVADVWPEFRSNGKDGIKVHHVLNHTSGMHNALADLTQEDPLLLCNWEECLNCIAKTVPEGSPGQQQLYHYLSFGWLCGGIVEHASGRKFQEILEEAFVRPLGIEGELYVGIPPGLESRLATLTVDNDDISKLSGMTSRSDLPSSFQPGDILQMINTLPATFNTLNVRRAILPAANGHCSARALARYYAALADGGVIPPPHSTSSKPLLGSHPHIPKFNVKKTVKKSEGRKKKGAYEALSTSDESKQVTSYEHSINLDGGDESRRSINSVPTNNFTAAGPEVNVHEYGSKIFNDESIHDAFLGAGQYENLIFPNGSFGLGFKRIKSKDGSLIGFGHSGMGGSTGFCDMKNRFAVSVTVNKMSFGSVTANIIKFICSELNLPVPVEYSGTGGPDMPASLEKPIIN
ncbi:uncharacterized protein LOC141670700 isoform X1 [Apium graveolens]|uniref:uncharacterized protein LOC141670700 isoform X1 n=2 Tax=Apium graveolens TaxID=4045 RepID=UPI003D792302